MVWYTLLMCTQTMVIMIYWLCGDIMDLLQYCISGIWGAFNCISCIVFNLINQRFHMTFTSNCKLKRRRGILNLRNSHRRYVCHKRGACIMTKGIATKITILMAFQSTLSASSSLIKQDAKAMLLNQIKFDADSFPIGIDGIHFTACPITKETLWDL